MIDHLSRLPSASRRMPANVYVLRASVTAGKSCAVLGLIVACLLLTGCGLAMGEAKPGADRTPEPPNIILIVTDDLDYRLLEEQPASYPNLRRLAAEGTSFENAFVTDPLCCPSRATILRGQYAHNHQIEGNEPPSGGFEKFHYLGYEDSTVATWLKDAGYRTALLGKYMNGYDTGYVPQGWDDWYGIAGNYLSNNLNENGHVVTYDSERYHLDDVLAEKAANSIQGAAADDPPFFMWLGTKAPHAPATPAPRHEENFADVSLPRVPSFDEEDVSDKPDWIADNPPLDEERVALMEELYRNRLRSMLAVDEMVGRLLEVLGENGELDNTFIFFTSDNGVHAGQHRLATGKWTAYEEDIRVPLIVRGPGVPEGQTVSHLVLNNDLAPTFADIAGTQAPPFVDGRSLLPLLTGDPPPEERWRQSFLVEAAGEFAGVPSPPFVDESSVKPPLTGDPLPEDWRRLSDKGSWSSEDWGRPALEAVRTERYLYVEYDTGERELYDLEEDPYQLENLLGGGAGGEVDPGLVGNLEDRLSALRGCAGASCRAAEDGGPEAGP